MEEGLPHTDDHCEIRDLSVDCHPCKQLWVSCKRGCPTHANNFAPFGHDKDNPHTRVLEYVQECVSTMISEPIGYRQSMRIEDLHEARWISFGRGVHGSNGVDARNHNEWTPLYPRSAVCIDMID